MTLIGSGRRRRIWGCTRETVGRRGPGQPSGRRAPPPPRFAWSPSPIPLRSTGEDQERPAALSSPACGGGGPPEGRWRGRWLASESARSDRGASCGSRLRRRPRPRDRAMDDGLPQAPASDRGRSGASEDRSRQGACRSAWLRAHPHAMLRGARRELGALRVELSTPVAGDQDARRYWRQRLRDRSADLLRGLSARAPAAERHPAKDVSGAAGR